MPEWYSDRIKTDVVAVACKGDLAVPEVATDFGVAEKTGRQ